MCNIYDMLQTLSNQNEFMKYLLQKMLMTILRSVFWQQQQIQEAIQPINEELLEPIMPDVKRRKGLD